MLSLRALALPLAAALLATSSSAQAYPTPTNGEIAQWVQEAIVTDALRRFPLSQQERFEQFGIRGDLVVAREATNTVLSRLGSSLTGSLVSCTNGVVTLRGRVDSPEHRDAAATAVKAIPGVVAVYNLLQAPGEETPANPPASAPREDPPAVLGPFGFLTDNLLGGTDLVVRVDQGQVVISGVVSNRMAERHVMAVAHGVPGVRTLQNQLDVRDGTREDDLRLALIIFRSFQYTTDLWKVWPAMSVDVRDGVARLSGRVKSEYQYDLATDIAASVRTIVAVDNQLEVDPSLVVDERAFDPSREPSTTITPDKYITWHFGD